jgi:hypothetical protein
MSDEKRVYRAQKLGKPPIIDDPWRQSYYTVTKENAALLYTTETDNTITRDGVSLKLDVTITLD